MMEHLETAMWNKGKTVRIAERYKFFKRDQLKEETITIYLDELKKLVTTCEFSAYLEDALCDKFVCGIQDQIIQADLLTRHDLTLDEAYQYALTMEVTRSVTDEKQPFLKRHKIEEDEELSNFEDFENSHYALDIKEELQPFDFEVHQEFVDFQSEPNLLMQAECDEQLLQFNDCDGKKKFLCEFCQKSFSSNSRLMDHRRTHTGEKPFICITCNKSFSRREGLRRHTQKLSGCANYDKQKPTFKENVKADKRKAEYVCAVCCRSFLQKAVLERHCRIHTGEKPYACKVCKNTFTRKDSLQQHLRIHGFEDHGLQKSVKKKPLKCKSCIRTFSKKTDLKRHLKIHTGKKDLNEKINGGGIKEEIVDTSIIDSDDKTEPLEKEIFLPKKIMKPILCHICDYRTAKPSSFKVHLMRHTGEKPFSCDICNYRAVCKSQLSTHKKSHIVEKLLICEFCGYKTNYSAILQTHIRSHTGEKPFHCKFCDYKCAERNSLKNHERIHTGEKPFSCNFCDYRAAQRTGLVYHLKTHNKEKPSVTEQ